MVHITSRTVLGPILVPYTPDCDYNNGEELLSYEKIEALKQSFKNYNIIDYQHQFTDEKGSYYMTNIGKPLRLFYNDDNMEFEDVTGTTVTVPPRTLWLESEITDEQAIKEIDEKQLVAYSVTVSEKSDANTVMEIYNKLITKTAQKEDIDHNVIQEINKKLSAKRTLIKDIEDPVLLTTSLVKFPCVNKAKFCKRSLIQTEEIKESDKMAEQKKDDANTTFINSIKDAVKQFRQSTPTETETEETITNSTLQEDVQTMIEEQVGALKEEINAEMKKEHEEVISAIKDLRTAPVITDEDKAVTQPPKEPVTETEEEVVDEEKEPEEEEEVEETETKKKTSGRGGKSKKEDIPLRQAEPSAQQSRKSAKITGDEPKMTVKRDEFSVIYDAVKNNMSMKGLTTDSINYDATGLRPYDHNFINFLDDPILQNAYKASFTIDETNTRKAILNTNLFTTYVTKLIQSEPLLEDATYQTGIHGKGHIYGLDDTIATEDGALPEHFYFDKDTAVQEATLEDKEIETYPQRVKINVSDRQRLANVYGDDLVNILLERAMARLRQGVAVARFYGNASAANSVDLQYRRQDGYLKSAGQQLTSSDVNLDKITDLFDAMFYALPEEAQIESECVFYVPTNVRRAYSSYFLDKAADRAIDFVGQKAPLYWGDAPIKVSPTLNNKPMRDALDGGNVSVLLTKPANTHFVVGREAGIEPKRYAETSSDAFYATMDTANAYSIDDYAVRLTLTAEEYASLIGGE
ncbi:hypothetical protein [Methanosphaera sp.]|uniref:hypothetical protein n=1 Tax=Methanosphaera sp. TaxID=2666342 RepID=UPI0025E1AF17|nr:hypothetical protein [Methanosphaera sp.]